jgi:hypothetical protein
MSANDQGSDGTAELFDAGDDSEFPFIFNGFT